MPRLSRRFGECTGGPPADWSSVSERGDILAASPSNSRSPGSRSQSLFPEAVPLEQALRELTWAKSAPAKLVDAVTVGNLARTAKELRKLLRIRRKGRPHAEALVALLSARQADGSEPLDSPFPSTLAEIFLRCVLADEFAGCDETLQEYFAESRGPVSPVNEEFAAAALLLKFSCLHLEDETLLELVTWLGRHVPRIDTEALEKPVSLERLLEAEALIVHGRALPFLKGAQKRVVAGRRLMRNWLKRELDLAGRPHARWIGALEEILATLATAALGSELCGEVLWDEQDAERLRNLAESVLALGSPGQFAFLGAPASIVQAIQGLGVYDWNDSPLLVLQGWAAAGERRGKREGTVHGTWSLPDESWQSDDSLWAAMRSDWISPADACRVLHHERLPQLDIVLRDIAAIAGDWGLSWSVNNEPVPLKKGWKCECWFSDDEVDYLELTQEFDSEEGEPASNGERDSRWQGTLIVRQVIFAKQDQCLVLTDSIRTPLDGEVEYESVLPVVGDFEWAQDSMTRECALMSKRLRVRVVPLGLPQQRVAFGVGGITFENNAIKLRQTGQRTAMYVPLVLEWSPARKRQPVDWTRLTVAEEGRKVTANEAAGFRVRVGDDQWFLYHELKVGRMPKSVMGVHTLNETVFSRFTREGTIRDLLLVEGDRS